MRISFCLITLNEEKNLPRCLDSLADLADEIIILDSGSTDSTRSIAEKYRAVWQQQPWEGFATQKNRAHALATQDWIFSLDADEVLSPTLRTELLSWKNRTPDPAIHGFSCPRLAIYQGRWIRHGDWYPNRRVRLFRRGSGQFEGGLVHQSLTVTGHIQRLQGDLLHYSFTGPDDHRKKSDHYARIWATSEHARGRTCTALTPWLRAATRWLRGYLLRGGFLDGRPGWTIAALNAREVFLKYRQLHTLGQVRVNSPN